MGRVLGARRLSNDTDVSTSIERQGDSIQTWASAYKHTVVTLTDDSDISGVVSPFDRPDLGPWLTDPFKLQQWDILAVAKLDRMGRSLIDFANTLIWCQEHNKTLVSVAEGLDFGTSMGQFIGKILILFAEWERETMRARRADAARKLLSKGEYNGGQSLSWGYMAVKDNDRNILVPDPELVAKIRVMVQEILDGASVNATAEKHDIPPASLRRRLQRVELKGWITYQGEVIRGEDGLPLEREPIVDEITWQRLQARLGVLSASPSLPRGSNPWLHVIWCEDCKNELFILNNKVTKRKTTGKVYYYRYYRHERKDKAANCLDKLWADSIENKINGLVMRAFTGRYVQEYIDLPGEDHSQELAQVEQAIADWEEKAMSPSASSDSVMRILDRLNTRRDALLAEGIQVPARRMVKETGEPLTDRWLACEDDNERGALLRSMGYRIIARKGKGREVSVRLQQVRDGDMRHWTEMVDELEDGFPGEEAVTSA